jgi:hypothetical protein
MLKCVILFMDQEKKATPFFGAVESGSIPQAADPLPPSATCSEDR